MKRSLVIMAAAAAVLAGPALAADHEIKMLNRGESGGFRAEVAPGDTVTFVATDRSHNAETIDGVLPDGVEGFVGPMNQDVTYAFEADGVYGIKCKPHYGMGMVALITVGEPENLADAASVKHPGKARKVFEDLLETAGS